MRWCFFLLFYHSFPQESVATSVLPFAYPLMMKSCWLGVKKDQGRILQPHHTEKHRLHTSQRWTMQQGAGLVLVESWGSKHTGSHGNARVFWQNCDINPCLIAMLMYSMFCPYIPSVFYKSLSHFTFEMVSFQRWIELFLRYVSWKSSSATFGTKISEYIERRFCCCFTSFQLHWLQLALQVRQRFIRNLCATCNCLNDEGFDFSCSFLTYMNSDFSCNLPVKHCLIDRQS